MSLRMVRLSARPGPLACKWDPDLRLLFLEIVVSQHQCINVNITIQTFKGTCIPAEYIGGTFFFSTKTGRQPNRAPPSSNFFFPKRSCNSGNLLPQVQVTNPPTQVKVPKPELMHANQPRHAVYRDVTKARIHMKIPQDNWNPPNMH